MTSIDTTAEVAVTEDDVRFLRWAIKASQVSCLAFWHTDTNEGGLRIIVRRREIIAGQEHEDEIERVIHVRSSHVDNYDGSSGDYLSALDMGAAGRYTATGVVRNLVDAGIKAGDTLRLYWSLGNNNHHLTEAGLSHDSCYVQIQRKGVPKGEFLVADMVVPRTGIRFCTWRAR